jgi:serine/threonine protein kinase
VAAKYLSGSWDEAKVAEFEEEAGVMATLRPHDNVIQLLGVVLHPQPCIVTRYYSKGSLRSHLDGPKRFTWRTCLKVLRGVAAGLAHLHREGIVHRDVAARNVLLSESMEGVLADLGFARVVQLGEDERSGSTTKSDVGPVKWFAVECITRREYSPKTDVWAFGVTAWEAVTRDLPYRRWDNLLTVSNVLAGERLEIPSSCEPRLARLLESCWSTEPSARPTAQQVFETLSSLDKRPHERIPRKSESQVEHENEDTDQAGRGYQNFELDPAGVYQNLGLSASGLPSGGAAGIAGRKR